MKTISTALLAYLTSPVQTIATLVKVTRQDGVVLGFTSWDSIITTGGVTYWPNVALQATAIMSNADLTTDQMDISGGIDGTLIIETDIDAGRYDRALVTIMRCNPLDLTMGTVTDLSGYLGEPTYGDGNLTIALNSLGVMANQQIGDIVSPLCRVRQLGDSQCKVNIASYQFSATVQSLTNNQVMVFNDTHATDYFTYGMVRWASLGGGGGLNHDLAMEVRSHTLTSGHAVITLQESMPFNVAMGDAATLEAGCDRRGYTCRNKFSNLVNFHGDPYVPGNDSLIKTGRPPS